MEISFQMSTSELSACCGPDLDFKKPVEITIGNEVFTCYIQEYSSFGVAIGWTLDKGWLVRAKGYSKRKQEIADAVLLVNQTKEAHKEAQRKLAELQKDEK